MDNPKTTAQIAAETGYSLRTVHRWIDAGLLVPALRLPGEKGVFLFDGAQVAAFCDEMAAKKAAMKTPAAA